MASASGAYFVSQTTPCPQSTVTPEFTSRSQIRHEMQREKLQLQELSSEYFGLLLEAYERHINPGKKCIRALTLFLDRCQSTLTTPNQLLPELTEPAELRFWYQFSTTIDQYCRLQQRLLNYPSNISGWQIEQPLCPAC